MLSTKVKSIQNVHRWQIPLILLTISLLTGCSILGSSVDKVETVSKPTERTPLNIEPAESVNLDDVEWYIITPENAEEILTQLKDSGHEPVIFGLTSSGYERLSLNFAEIRKHINTQRRILLQYKQYYEDSTSPESSEQ